MSSTTARTLDNNRAKWGKATGMAVIIVLIDVGLYFFGAYFEKYLTFSIFAVGIVTFFGMLSTSKYAALDTDQGGHMRTAITGMLLSVYIGLLIETMYGKTSPVAGASDLLKSFTDVIMVLIVFYFGSKALTEAAAYFKKN